MTASSSAGSSRHRHAAALLGPTASGKSALALALAARLDAEIISVDSGAVYRGMDIGTATPDAAMRAQIPHHLINITDPTDTYNVGRFYRDAVDCAADIRARGKLPLFVGGTMMYFNALFAGLTPHPPVPAAITEAVRQEAEQEGGLQTLHAELQRTAPTAAARLPVRDAQRIVRAVALHRSGWTEDGAPDAPAPPLEITPLLLVPARRDLLRTRIRTRLDEMWTAGLLEETRALLEKWKLPPQSAPLKLAGYKQAAQHLRGEISVDEMREKAATATCQLAKRQLTWMKKWQKKGCVLEPFGDADLPAQALAALTF